MILHSLWAGSPVVTDTGCCPSAAQAQLLPGPSRPQSEPAARRPQGQDTHRDTTDRSIVLERSVAAARLNGEGQLNQPLHTMQCRAVLAVSVSSLRPAQWPSRSDRD